MNSQPSTDTALPSSLRARGRVRWLAAVLRWLSIAALSALVLTLVATDQPAAVAGSNVAAASVAQSGPPVRIKCRVVGLRVALGLHHHHALRDGSARSISAHDTGRASLVDDLDDASSATDDWEPVASLVRAPRADDSAGPPRDGPTADPTRFAAGRGLPRGPPA